MTSDTQTASHYPVYKTLARALSSSVEAYKIILSDNEDVTIYRVFLWNTITSYLALCSLVLAWAIFKAFPSNARIGHQMIFLGAALTPLLALAYLFGHAGIGNWIATRILDKGASFKQLVLGYGASFAALSIVSAHLGFMSIGINSLDIKPISSAVSTVISVLTYIYRVVLGIVAAQAVYEINRVKAAVVASTLILEALFFIAISILLYLI